MNAGITRELDISKTFFDSMISLQGSVAVGDTSKQDELLLNMKKDIYDRLPDLFDIEEAQKLYPVAYMESMNTVLTQEMERYNILLKEIKTSLMMLEKAVQGMIVMTPGLEVKLEFRNLDSRFKILNCSLTLVDFNAFNKFLSFSDTFDVYAECKTSSHLGKSECLSNFKTFAQFYKRLPGATQFFYKVARKWKTTDFLDSRIFICSCFFNWSHSEFR